MMQYQSVCLPLPFVAGEGDEGKSQTVAYPIDQHIKYIEGDN